MLGLRSGGSEVTVVIGGLRIVECQIEGCNREAETDIQVNTPRDRGSLGVCFPCARAIRIGERSASKGPVTVGRGRIP